jgi:hypothetical protein
MVYIIISRSQKAYVLICKTKRYVFNRWLKVCDRERDVSLYDCDLADTIFSWVVTSSITQITIKIKRYQLASINEVFNINVDTVHHTNFWKYKITLLYLIVMRNLSTICGEMFHLFIMKL